MSHKGLREPHILLASGNSKKLMRNLAGVLTNSQLTRIQNAVNKNVILLYRLAEDHRNFALGVSNSEWRQIISRLYYAAYNSRRALTLACDGAFSTDSSDHQRVDSLPDDFQNRNTFSNKIKNLREDRNLCDYSHLAEESDLMISVQEAKTVVVDFMSEVSLYLTAKGVAL